MNITKKIALGLLIANTFLLSEIKYLSQEQINTIYKNTKAFDKVPIKVIEGIEEEDTYFLDVIYRGKARHCFLNKKNGSYYIGRRYDNEGKAFKFIKSPERIAKFKKTIKEGISFSYGTGKKDLYVFTDPQCGYCKKFEKQSEGLLEEYTVHVILFPLRFHKKAPAMIEWTMGGSNDKEKNERLKAIMVKSDTQYEKFLPKDKKPMHYTAATKKRVENAMKAAKALHVTGTPTLFDASFKKLNWGKFLRQEQAKKKGYKPFKTRL